MEYAQRIGARIARLRTEKHLTQGQLAQAAGVPRDALARWIAVSASRRTKASHGSVSPLPRWTVLSNTQSWSF